MGLTYVIYEIFFRDLRILPSRDDDDVLRDGVVFYDDD
jgi:hypothetical protein